MITSRDSITRWFEANRLRLAGRGAWLSGGEPGRLDPSGFEAARIRILFCRLSTYRDVLHSISHRMLYWAAAGVPGVHADLAWLPPPRDARLMTAAGVPWWTASGAHEAPGAFDVLAVSISTPQEALNLPAALRNSGIALSRTERAAAGNQPLVVIGGQAAGSVPFIHGADGNGLVDVVCLGDGIEWLREMLGLCLRTGRGNLHGMLAGLARIPGSYIPSLYSHRYDAAGSLSIAAATPDAPLPAVNRSDRPDSWTGGYDGAYIPFDDEEQEETIPLAFGCRYRCRFCQTGWARADLAPTPPEALAACAGRLKAAMAASDLNLLASDACSVAGLDRIVQRLAPSFRHVSVKSLALASLSRHPETDAVMEMLDKREYTFGVEGISPRLRRWLGKQADAPVLNAAVARLAGSGIRQLKLFFILTGLETEEDAQDLRALLAGIRAAGGCRVIASFTPLFHSPFTPLQFAPLRETGPGLVRSVRRAVSSAGAEFRLSAGPAEIRLMNLLCRAGRRATRTLIRLSLDRGLLYYDALPEDALALAEKELAADGIRPDALSGDMSDRVLPWDDMQAGHTRGELLVSYRRAQEEAAGESRAEPARNRAAARRAHRRHRPSPAPAEITLSFGLDLDPREAIGPDVTLARGALRRMFLDDPDLARAYRGSPRLVRFPLAAGRAGLQAAFLAGAGPKAVRPLAAALPDAPWYVVRFPADPEIISNWLSVLRRMRAPVQSVRREDGMWHLVSPAHRVKSGLAAAIESAGTLRLVCSRAAAGQVAEPDLRLLAGGVTEAIGGMAAGKCRVCGSRAFAPLSGEPGVSLAAGSLCAH